MKNCAYYREQISAMLDGELSKAEAVELQTHLASCDDCSTFCVALAATSGAAETESLPDGLHNKIMDRIDRAKKKRSTLTLLRPALISAACVGVILGVVLAAATGQRNGTSMEAVADIVAANGNSGGDSGAMESEKYVVSEAPASAYGEDASEINEFSVSADLPEERESPAEAAEADTEDEGIYALTSDSAAIWPGTLELEVVETGEDGLVYGKVLSSWDEHIIPLEMIVTIQVGLEEKPALGDRITIQFESVAFSAGGPLIEPTELNIE